MKYKKLLINFFKKTTFLQIALIVVGILSLFRLSFDFSNSNNKDLATLIINFETEKRLFEGEVVKDMTILDALSMAVSVGKIKLNYAINDSGEVNILEIDDHINGIENKYFVFYLNSKRIDTKNLNKEMVHNGDRIEIKNE